MTNFKEIYQKLKELNEEYRKDYDREKYVELTEYESEIEDLFEPLFLTLSDFAIEQAREIKLKDIPLDKQKLLVYLTYSELPKELDVLTTGQYFVNEYQYGRNSPSTYYHVGYTKMGYALPFTTTNFDEKSAVREMYANHLYLNLDFLEMEKDNPIHLPSKIKRRLYSWESLLKEIKWNRQGKLSVSLKEQ